MRPVLCPQHRKAPAESRSQSRPGFVEKKEGELNYMRFVVLGFGPIICANHLKREEFSNLLWG